MLGFLVSDSALATGKSTDYTPLLNGARCVMVVEGADKRCRRNHQSSPALQAVHHARATCDGSAAA